MPISQADYCSKVCGGQCCTLHDDKTGDHFTCPMLGPDKLCTIYEQRFGPGSKTFEIITTFESKATDKRGLPIIRDFWCGRIALLLEAGQVPEHIAAQCCIKFPHLLDKDYGSET